MWTMGISSDPYLKLVPLPVLDVNHGDLDWSIPDVDCDDLYWPIPGSWCLSLYQMWTVMIYAVDKHKVITIEISFLGFPRGMWL